LIITGKNCKEGGMGEVEKMGMGEVENGRR
jgi:hypothetical protein